MWWTGVGFPKSLLSIWGVKPVGQISPPWPPKQGSCQSSTTNWNMDNSYIPPNATTTSNKAIPFSGSLFYSGVLWKVIKLCERNVPILHCNTAHVWLSLPSFLQQNSLYFLVLQFCRSSSGFLFIIEKMQGNTNTFRQICMSVYCFYLIINFHIYFFCVGGFLSCT